MLTKAQSDGLLKQIPKLFYKNKAINYKIICVLASSLVVGAYYLKHFVQANKQNRVRFNKWYYKSHANALQYINILVRVHLPLSINSIFIISHLRYLKNRDKPLDYDDIKSGYIYGLLNYVLTAHIISKICDYYLYNSLSSDTTIQMFERFILSSAQERLATRMKQTNVLLEERLSSAVDDIKALENIIWQYIGAPDQAVDYTEFEEVLNYVQVLKEKFVNDQRHFVFWNYLAKRAWQWFDASDVFDWKSDDIVMSLAKIPLYVVRLFGKMTLSQIWYLTILEVSGNHDLLLQYLYSLMGREPLYLAIGLPFFMLRFTRLRADLLSAKLKDGIVYVEKGITQRLFGAEGFTQ
eukprot:171223_1